MKRAKADFIQKISLYFRSLNFDLNGRELCVCLSGGADSVSLLRGLIEISGEFGFFVSACHFNHMIRGAESDRDENFCKELCESLKIPLYLGRDDVPRYAKLRKLSLEEAARDCRYSYFMRLIENKSVDYCLTAHNMNDNAETLLFNLVRGTGLNGASAIAPVLNNSFLRPLLKVSRAEIEYYLNEIGQQYVIDSTNLSTEYSRNQIRLNIIPEMMKLNPSVVESFSRFIDYCREDKEYFDDVVKNNMDVDLRILPNSIKHRVIMKKYKDFSGDSLSSKMINFIEDNLGNDTRTVLKINDIHEAVIKDGKIDFYTIDHSNCMYFDAVSIIDGDNSIFAHKVIIKSSHRGFDSYENFNKIYTTAKLSYDNIIGEVKARSRCAGDKICIHGINRSVKKLLIEKKVPKEYRDIIPILFDDEGIIYIPFIGIADRVFTEQESDCIYITTVMKDIDKERWINAYEK